MLILEYPHFTCPHLFWEGVERWWECGPQKAKISTFGGKHRVFAPTAGGRSTIFPKLSDRARRDHQKGANHFSIQRIVFPTGKFGLIDGRAVCQQ